FIVYVLFHLKEFDLLPAKCSYLNPNLYGIFLLNGLHLPLIQNHPHRLQKFPPILSATVLISITSYPKNIVGLARSVNIVLV
ncbi:hypothetical protein, partial [Actinobacillus porcinus]|uniref:hypothetical protein n=1 Tax=Actinobacillus porcinus TaxID=51048 RepID=UPI002355BD00